MTNSEYRNIVDKIAATTKKIKDIDFTIDLIKRRAGANEHVAIQVGIVGCLLLDKGDQEKDFLLFLGDQREKLDAQLLDLVQQLTK